MLPALPPHACLLLLLNTPQSDSLLLLLPHLPHVQTCARPWVLCAWRRRGSSRPWPAQTASLASAPTCSMARGCGHAGRAQQAK